MAQLWRRLSTTGIYPHPVGTIRAHLNTHHPRIGPVSMPQIPWLDGIVY
ncbi:MAG TPA: hypothetical protein VME43_13920 [Bryobacteraceae bacterium]|nr:hypothetical protein [Bryobacteraceae bacterium]